MSPKIHGQEAAPAKLFALPTPSKPKQLWSKGRQIILGEDPSVEDADGGSATTTISKAAPDGTAYSRLGNTGSDDRNMRALGRRQEVNASSVQG